MFKQERIYTYDGSLDGLFCVVFRAFEDKVSPSAIIPRKAGNQVPLGEIVPVDTVSSNAQRVWKGIIDRSDQKNARKISVAFLSERPETDMLLWRYLNKLFTHPYGDYYKNMLDEDVYEITQTARRVRMEVHRFQGFVRFQRTRDDIYAAAIDPDNDIVQLLAPHFKGRFSDRRWLIYDTRRKYGIFYDMQQISIVALDDDSFSLTSGNIRRNARAVDEDYYRTLWQHYYDAVNIKERKNDRQMRSFMPVRYWKYLPEKDR